MKFIVSTFNPNKMVIDDNFDMEKRQLSEDEFLALCFDAYSCVGYEDVALMLNVAHNKEPVKARIGDVILLAGKGHEDYQVVGKTKHHMDEREIVAGYLSERKQKGSSQC
jgi:UDP-N-acetylmuramyl tripeptide synthase